MKAGDLVWYLQVIPGGYGFTNRVPAVFLKQTQRRVVVEVLLKGGGRTQIAVMSRNILPRQPDEAVVWQ